LSGLRYRADCGTVETIKPERGRAQRITPYGMPVSLAEAKNAAAAAEAEARKITLIPTS
jgi:hypothetical protein